jgi:4-amino-4-deoxy-L-arabinose transferase-like glycosyltransferase
MMYSTLSEMKYRAQFLTIFSVLCIFVVALAVRLYHLDQSPKGALIDEAHFGFIAKSLLLTGKDEHGQSWPIIFKGFGDQKLPGYAYLLIPFVALFDLSVTTIRLPSAFVGALSVILIYVLARKIGFRHWSAWFASVLMAVSPWSFFLSRFGFESNLALFFWLIGLIGLVSTVQYTKPVKNWLFWPVVTGVSFALTWYSYIAYRPITAGLLIALLFIAAVWKRQLLKPIGVVFLTLAVFVSPLFHPAVSASNTARLQQVGLFSDERNVAIINEYRTFCDMQLPLKVCSVVWNKGTLALQTLTARFFHVFSPEFLATSGEANETFLNVKGFGQFTMVVYPLFILGLMEIVLRKKLRVVEWIILLGLLLAPLPTILAGEPQKVRISALLPFIILVALYGVHRLAEILKDIKIKQLPKGFLPLVVGGTFVVIFLTSTVSYMVDFFTVQTIKNDYMYQSYLRTLFPVIKEKYNDQTLLIKPFFSDPTMFYAFHTNMDPSEYQRQAVLGPLEGSGFQHTIAIDKVKVIESGYLDAFCKAVAADTPTLYLTDERAPDSVVLERGRSENGAMTYAFLYDALTSGRLHVMECNDIPLAERQQINKEVEQSGLRQKVLGTTPAQ